MHAHLVAHPSPWSSLSAAHAAWRPQVDDDAVTDDNRVVEVVWRWRGAVRGVVRARDGQIAIGAGTDLAVPLSAGGTWTLVTSTTSGVVVCSPPGLTVTQRRRSERTSAAVAGTLRLDDDVVVGVEVGEHRLEVCTVARARAPMLAPVFDALWANTALLACCVVALLLGTTLFFPVDMDDLDDVLATHPTRVSSVLLRAAPRRIAAPPTASASSGSAPAATRARAPRPERQPRAAARSDRDVVASRLASLLGEAGLATALSSSSSSAALSSALAGLDGRQVATGDGRGGLGLRAGPAGDGEGRVGTGTLGIGTIVTRGRGSGDGDDDGRFHLIAKEDREPTVVVDTPTVTGTLDPELIRQVVRSHAGQVRYCYEQHLTATPGLAGRVVMKWVIDRSGAVASVHSADDQLHHDGVTACLASRIRTWRFPQPRGGGVVVVNYPFVFKQAG